MHYGTFVTCDVHRFDTWFYIIRSVQLDAGSECDMSNDLTRSHFHLCTVSSKYLMIYTKYKMTCIMH